MESICAVKWRASLREEDAPVYQGTSSVELAADWSGVSLAGVFSGEALGLRSRRRMTLARRGGVGAPENDPYAECESEFRKFV
jgi:hypothetical protein